MRVPFGLSQSGSRLFVAGLFVAVFPDNDLDFFAVKHDLTLGERRLGFVTARQPQPPMLFSFFFPSIYNRKYHCYQQL
jgi:hypothetical protein